MQYQITQLSEDQENMKEERTTLDAHLEILETQRNELRKELDIFLQADIMVKRDLDRFNVV